MLIYYFGDKKIDMSKKEFDSHYINEGLESNVYLFNDRVIKIYKPKCVKIRLDEDTVKRLSKINTERIIMPQDVVYNELNKFSGYTMKYIESFDNYFINNLNINFLVDELEKYENDIKILSRNKITITDICLCNFIFNDGIYFIDPGSFLYEDHLIDYSGLSEKNGIIETELFNRQELNTFFITNFLRIYGKVPKCKSKILCKQFSYLAPLSSQIKDTMVDGESIKEYAKRLIKK